MKSNKNYIEMQLNKKIKKIKIIEILIKDILNGKYS